MQQVIENWADIKGKVASVEPHPELDGYSNATIDVETVSPVSGFANLFSSAAGGQVTVNVHTAKVAELGLAPGTSISSRIRKFGPLSAFADPDSIRSS
jgi:hypothetical protein